MKRMIHLFICLAIIVLLSGCDILLGLYATVDFDSNGGTRVKPTYVSFGDLANEPRDPERNGYIFIGWYLGDKKWNFSNDVVEEDITLKARWKPNIPANYDTNAAWQLLRGTWTNGTYTVTFGYRTGYNTKIVTWSGHGESGWDGFSGPYYDTSKKVMYGEVWDSVWSWDYFRMDIIFSMDGTTMEFFPRYYSCEFLPIGIWTKLP